MSCGTYDPTYHVAILRILISSMVLTIWMAAGVAVWLVAQVVVVT
jgi:hypothetical protein